MAAEEEEGTVLCGARSEMGRDRERREAEEYERWKEGEQEKTNGPQEKTEGLLYRRRRVVYR